jgi:hypothetical protein
MSPTRWREAPSKHGREGTRRSLRGVIASLVRQQGYMLAQIVKEIHAPDLEWGWMRRRDVQADDVDDTDLIAR